MNPLATLPGQIVVMRRSYGRTLLEWPYFPDRKVSFKPGILGFLPGTFRQINHSTWSDRTIPSMQTAET
jgi:hypothetical protein